MDHPTQTANQIELQMKMPEDFAIIRVIGLISIDSQSRPPWVMIFIPPQVYLLWLVLIVS